MCKDDFKYLSQEFDSNVLDIVKQKGFCPYEYMSSFEKFQGEFLSLACIWNENDERLK